MKKFKAAGSALFTGLLLITFFACNNPDDDIDLKNNEEAKEKAFEQILNDEELFTEFTGRMRENRQAMEWMRENRPMMRGFYERGQMREMMRQNPEMRQQMMENMMEMMENDTTMRPYPQMRRQMMQHMMRMMERDTAMQQRMREMMQNHQMN